MTMAKVAQIIPYFGKWPEWIDLYLYSCGRNQMMDFIFYTDCPLPTKVYPNTIFHSVSKDEYCKMVGVALGVEYKFKDPYKLTDLKPFMGLVHRKELARYEFWSFGDLDLCYGDLSMLVNDRNLAKYDVITSHSYHIAGHFTLVRNIEKLNTLCLRINDWAERLNDETHYSFDEGEFSGYIYPRMRYVRAFYEKILKPLRVVGFFPWLEFANPKVNPGQLFSEFYTSPAPKQGEKWTYDTSSGKITDPKGRELPYLHFLFFKKTKWLETENYWREGYYKLKSDIEGYSRITFDLNGIVGE